MVVKFLVFGAIGVVLWFCSTLVCAIVCIAGVFVGLILLLRKISVWSKRGEKQELLNPET